MSEQPIRIGYCLSLSGPLASNGKTARLAHQIWENDVNRKGGLLGRKLQMICIDDETDPKLVPEIYKRLLDDEKVDLVIGGYGDNSVAPAMPLIMERKRYLVALMALAVNASLDYSNYFVMIPTGPRPNEALTEGFFALAAKLSPKPGSMAILAADALFSKGPVQGAKVHADKHAFKVVSDARYPLLATDLAPFIRDLKPINPDILFLCSYLNDSVSLLRAIDQVGLDPKMVGGSMIGPQNGSIKAQLGPLLNGLVNYEYWLPVPTMMYPGIAQMIAEYQSLAANAVRIRLVTTSPRRPTPKCRLSSRPSPEPARWTMQGWHNSRAIARSRPLSARSNSERAVAGRRRAFFRCNIRTSRAPIFRISETQGRKRSSGRRVSHRARSSIPMRKRNGRCEAVSFRNTRTP